MDNYKITLNVQSIRTKRECTLIQEGTVLEKIPIKVDFEETVLNLLKNSCFSAGCVFISIDIEKNGGYYDHDECYRIVNDTWTTLKERLPIIKFSVSGASRYPIEDRKEGEYYFQLRTGDCSRKTLIEDFVLVNNEGSMAASRDILYDAYVLGINDGERIPVFMDELWDMYEQVVQ